LGGVRRAAGDATGFLRDKAGGALARLRELAGSTGRRLEDGVRSMVNGAGELLGGLRRRAAELWQGLRQAWQSLRQRASQALASLRRGWDWLKGKASDAWQRLSSAIAGLRGRATTALGHAEGDACEFKVAAGEGRSLAGATVDTPGLPAGAPAVMLKTEAGAPPRPAHPRALAARLGQGGGHQLEAPVRTRMESAFGADLSGVTLHTDSRAAEMAGSLGARAFTVGRQIAFSAGEYRPGTLVGDALIAHEVAHVLQQRSGASADHDGAGGGDPDHLAHGEDSAAELDADHSAVRAVSRIWLGLGRASEGWLGQAMPRLRTGLRLRRCAKSPEQCCEEGATAVASGALASVPAGHSCEPTGDTRENVFSHQKLKEATARPSVYGWTEIAKPPRDVFDFIQKGNARAAGKCGDKCKPDLPGNVPSLRLSLFIFTKAGRYPEGTRKVKSGRCAGKKLPHFERISPKLAERIRAAEVEHCRDHSRAWELTYGKYLAAVLELKDGFCPDPATPGKGLADRCAADYERRLRERSGFASAGAAHAAFDCLTNQTLDRDKGSHTVKGKSVVEPDKDCSEVDLVVPDANALPEVGKKSAAELLKDSEAACGVPGAK
ncbi:MAG TPA: DUF4157 domain-containing protein, partial [Acidimicrobiales bacterium]|nr:DUF4157 domain-containing protein [Acidimicrobiales bacterium]